MKQFIKGEFDAQDKLNENFDEINASLSEKAKQSDINTTNANLAQLSNPNLLINGDFQVWQRGASITCNNGVHYTADRWLMWNGSGITTIASGGWNMTWTTGGNDNLIQIVEMPTRNIGRAMTLSCLIDVPVGLTVSIHCAGATSATVSDMGTTIVYTGIGTWQNITIPIPASSNTKSLFMVQFSTGAAAGTSIGITNVKLEIGTLATTFVSRPYAEELALCQRYYEQVFFSTRLVTDMSQVNQGIEINVPLKVKKRIPPTQVITRYTCESGTANINVYNDHTQDLFCAFLTQNVNTSLGKGCRITYEGISDAEIY